MKFLYFYLCLIPTDVTARSDQWYDDILFVPLIIFFLLVVAQYCNSFFYYLFSFSNHTLLSNVLVLFSLLFLWMSFFFFALYLYQQPYSLRCDLQLLETLSIFSPFITLQKLFTECFLLSLCRSSMLRCLIVVDFWN